MRKKLLVLAVLGWAATNPAWAGYTIDGNLSDWGVSPFSQWVPNAPASYVVTDNVNTYGASGYGEDYDFEAMYFASDVDHFYVAAVSSFAIGTGTGVGDLGLDLNGDMTVSLEGAVKGLEYAVHVGTPGWGQVVYDPVWGACLGFEGSPYRAKGGTLIGSATMAVDYDSTLEDGAGAYILEAAIPRSIFPDNGGDFGDLVGIHLSMLCGNDSINLEGKITTETPVIPAPGAVVLGGLGVGLIGWLRRGRALT